MKRQAYIDQKHRPITKQQADEYCKYVARWYHSEPCEHGHFGCALWNGGPCESEIAAEFELIDD